MPDPLVLPVFPLDGVILFPRTMLPLHIFEPRYRQLVSDLLAKPEDDRLIVISNLDFQGKPKGKNPFAQIATVGRLVHVEKFEDGKSNIVLYGQFTAEVEEVTPSSKPYRLCRIKSIREEFWNDPLGDHQDEKQKLMAAIHAFMERTNLKIENLDKISVDDLVNGLSFSLELQGNAKQELLELQKMDKRLRKLITLLDDTGFYTEFVPDEEDYTGLN